MSFAPLLVRRSRELTGVMDPKKQVQHTSKNFHMAFAWMVTSVEGTASRETFATRLSQILEMPWIRVPFLKIVDILDIFLTFAAVWKTGLLKCAGVSPLQITLLDRSRLYCIVCKVFFLSFS